jgi:large exoprotein involved in heme utilization and adhesion
MTDGAKFYASPSQPSVLSIAAVAAFGFLGTNPGGTITIQGSTLRTNGFAPMTFIGRDLTVNNTTTPGITITGSAALAPYYNPGGLVLISVGQVADPITGGEVRVAPATSEISPFSLTYDLSGFGNGGTVVAETFVADHFMVLTPPSGNVTINRASTDGDLTPININTGILQINEGLFASGALASGPIDLRAANSFRLNGTISSVNSEFQGTPITITSPSVLLASNARIMTDNSGFFAGPVILNVGTLEVSSGSLVSSRATPGGTGSGDITIQGLDGAGSGATSVNIAGSITSEVRSFGTGGNIVINAQNISLDSGGLISSAAPIPTFDGAPPGSGGSAGNVTINASGMFQSSGGTVTSTTVDGPGGNISLKVGAMSLTNGTTIAASTTGSGKAGNVTLEVGTLTASNATLTTTSTSSTNTAGTAGNITVTSAQDLTLRNSVVQTSADQASGGNIKLTAPNLIRIVDSTITSSVKGQAGSNGGNIDIDPQVVVIQNSDILARANAGAGGNINIAALGAVLVDPNSAIDASAATGVSGSVNISSPIQDSAAPWSL